MSRRGAPERYRQEEPETYISKIAETSISLDCPGSVCFYQATTTTATFLITESPSNQGKVTYTMTITPDAGNYVAAQLFTSLTQTVATFPAGKAATGAVFPPVIGIKNNLLNSANLNKFYYTVIGLSSQQNYSMTITALADSGSAVSMSYSQGCPNPKGTLCSTVSSESYGTETQQYAPLTMIRWKQGTYDAPTISASSSGTTISVTLTAPVLCGNDCLGNIVYTGGTNQLTNGINMNTSTSVDSSGVVSWRTTNITYNPKFSSYSYYLGYIDSSATSSAITWSGSIPVPSGISGCDQRWQTGLGSGGTYSAGGAGFAVDSTSGAITITGLNQCKTYNLYALIANPWETPTMVSTALAQSPLVGDLPRTHPPYNNMVFDGTLSRYTLPVSTAQNTGYQTISTACAATGSSGSSTEPSEGTTVNIISAEEQTNNPTFMIFLIATAAFIFFYIYKKRRMN